MRKGGLFALMLFILDCSRQPQNVATFCRDFNPSGCVGPENESIVFPIEKSERKKTFRDFWNSVYFRGDRLAFAIKNADARREVTFECLHGHYNFAEDTTAKLELEYIELRDKDVYGLVMLGAMLEKRFPERRNTPYAPPPPFEVTYHVFCGKDPLMQKKIRVEMK